MSARPRYQWGHARPTTCVHGHEYTDANTKVVINETGRPQRRCRTCERTAGRLCKQRRKQRERSMRCEHCGYKLIQGRCPIPCEGKSRVKDAALGICQSVRTAATAAVVYWSPAKPNEATA